MVPKRLHNFIIPLYTVVACLLLFISTPVLTKAELIPKNPKKTSWHIAAQSLSFDKTRNLYIAENDVVLTGGKTILEADYLEFSNKTQIAYAKGNVLLISGEDSITSTAMRINLATETGTIEKGNIFVQKNNFHISGENIKKTGESTYTADKGAITSCDGKNPDWKITGKDIEVTIGGHGTAKHTVLWAQKAPVLYSPYLIFPVRTKRQTGFLIPRAVSSDRKGIELEQPFFWAISRSTDATFYADYMSDRGTKFGAEYRYIWSQKTKGSISFDFLEDEKTDDGTTDTELYSYSSTPQRTNSDRFWLRMKLDQELPYEFNAKLDIDFVSDEDYLHEFRDGFTGYDETKKYFEKNFGRSLDEYTDYIRKNWLGITRSWSKYTFKIDTYWYDDSRARRQNTDDTTLQTLPSVQFDASKQQIGNSKLFYSLDSDYTNFYRQDTTATLVNGQRIDIYPKIFMPVKLGRYFNFEPSLGFRETLYYTDEFTDIHGNSDEFRTREIYDIGAELSTKIIKVFHPANSYAQKIKHEIIPKLEYAYIPYSYQGDLPSFDGKDRIAETNLLTWSVSNNFISKKMRITPGGDEDFFYEDIAYIKLSQTYDIKKERDNDPQPFSNIRLESELNLIKHFSLDSDIEWSPYDSHFKIVNISSVIRDNRGDYLETEYRYNSSTSETLYGKINLRLNDKLETYYSIEQNLIDKKTVETQAGFTYKKACWKFDLFFEEADGENSITFLINLVGIGEFGTK